MPVTPDDISTRTLRRRRRGYDPHQVEQLLARIATDYRGALERIAYEAAAPTEELGRIHRQAHADAATEAAAMRARAEQAADAITRQARALRAQAQADADAARARLENADIQARRLEDRARRRWDSFRADAEQHWEKLVAADRELDARIGQLTRALARLRGKIALLEEIDDLEADVAALRTHSAPVAPHPDDRP